MPYYFVSPDPVSPETTLAVDTLADALDIARTVVTSPGNRTAVIWWASPDYPAAPYRWRLTVEATAE